MSELREQIWALLELLWGPGPAVAVQDSSHTLVRQLPFWFFLTLGPFGPFAILLFFGPSSRAFTFFSVALAAGVGLPLERRYVRFESAGVSARRRALKAAVGLGGMGSLLLAYGLLRAAHPVLGYAMLALAVLWGVLLAPALFASEGCRQDQMEARKREL